MKSEPKDNRRRGRIPHQRYPFRPHRQGLERYRKPKVFTTHKAMGGCGSTDINQAGTTNNKSDNTKPTNGVSSEGLGAEVMMCCWKGSRNLIAVGVGNMYARGHGLHPHLPHDFSRCDCQGIQ